MHIPGAKTVRKRTRKKRDDDDPFVNGEMWKPIAAFVRWPMQLDMEMDVIARDLLLHMYSNYTLCQFDVFRIISSSIRVSHVGTHVFH